MNFKFILRRKRSTIVYIIIAVICSYFLINRLTPNGRREQTAEKEKGFAEEQQRIFFIESSGEECLTARQVCSVESAAISNRHSQIIVYFSSSKFQLQSSNKPGQQRNCHATETLKTLGNVHFVTGNLKEHLRDTELWRLVSKGLLEKSRFPVMHWSDAARIALLWKNGGVYLDLDCIVMRRIDHLRNTAGLVSHIPNWIENGVLAFDKNNPFLRNLMKYMVFAYDPEEYISLGPLAMTQGMKEICSVEQLESLKEYRCLKGGRILLQPPSAFYAVSNEDQQMFYEARFNHSYWNLLQESYLSHVYDAGNGRVVPFDSLYASMARQFCPVTYSVAQQTAGF